MNIVITIFLLLTLMLIFFAFFLFSYRIGMGNIDWKIIFGKKECAVFSAFAFAVLFLCIYLLGQNRFVYYWDYGGYWTKSYTQMEYMFSDPVHAFGHMYRSICNDDYNVLLPTLISIPLKIIGYTFGRYVLVNVICFFFPLMFILLSICVKIAEIAKSNVNRKLVFIAVSLGFIVTFNAFYIAMLDGYIDIACLIPGSLSILLFIDYDSTSLNKKQIIKDFLISGNLLCTFLFRRYFAYFIVGYATALILYSFYISFIKEENGEKIRGLFHALLNLFIICGVALTILVIFFRPLLIHVLTNDYAGQYAGYDLPMTDKIRRVIEAFGGLAVILALVCVILSMAGKRYRKLSLFCGITVFITSYAFFRVQSMGIQHIYTIALELFLMDFLCVKLMTDLAKSIKMKVATVGVCLAVSICGSLNCFFPATRIAFARVSKAFSEEYNPLQRNDIDVLHQLVDYLNSLTEETDTRVYIDASGYILNNSIISSLDKPYGGSPLHNQCTTADVDLRDGFPVDFLSAGIIVTTDPVQLTLAEGTQEVVRFLSQEVTNPNSPIGRHFMEDPTTFTLDSGVVVHIYIKKSGFEESDLQYLADYFTDYYPGEETIFADRILNPEEQ